MEVRTEYLGGSTFEVSARGHSVICDQPRDNGGEDSGMSPPEFLLASLGACAAYYGTQYLITRGFNPKPFGVRVVAEKALRPARLSSFRIEIDAPDLDEHHRDGLMRAVKACLIHNTLLAQPTIDIVLNSPVLVVS